MKYNYTIPDHTFHTEHSIDVWAYPGNDSIRILKRPLYINAALLDMKVSSNRRPFDNWFQPPYGLMWESPGFITVLDMWHRLVNVKRLQFFSEQHNIKLRYLQPQEYVEEYQMVYEKPFPVGVLQCAPDYDYYTVKRMRHLMFFKLGEIPQKDWEFMAGIGKKMGAGHDITFKQRFWIRDLLKEFGNNEHNILDGAYETIWDKNQSYKHPF